VEQPSQQYAKEGSIWSLYGKSDDPIQATAEKRAVMNVIHTSDNNIN